LTKILIPRSDSVSAKIIEPSDFTEFFSFIDDYIVNGFSVTAGSGLAVNISSGLARLKGLSINSTASESVSSLTASTTNYIWITLARDGNGEAESWNFTKGVSATIPTDSVLVAKVITSGSAVTAVDENDTPKDVGLNNTKAWGGGGDGNVTISSNTTLSDVKYYGNLVINSGVTITKAASPLIIYAKGTITVNGTIDMSGKGGSGGSQKTSQGNGNTGGTSINMQQGTGSTGGQGAGGQGGGSYPGGQDNAAQAGGDGGSGGAGGANSSSVSPNTKHVTKYTMSETNFVGAGGGSGGGGGNGGNSGFPNNTSPCSGVINGSNAASGKGIGGAGGAGGGMIVLICNSVVIGSGGVIKTNGDNGSAGTGGMLSEDYNSSGCNFGGDSGAGGGGAGGNGGYIYLVYNSLTNNGSNNITVNGGTGGAAGTGGHTSNGVSAAGANGTVGLILHDD
jgi:hypothetical protein